MIWAVQVARDGEISNAYKILVGNPAGKRLLARSGHRWRDNITMALREG
jgi:hypothetical protein